MVQIYPILTAFYLICNRTVDKSVYPELFIKLAQLTRLIS
jgi:hypothetical protein